MNDIQLILVDPNTDLCESWRKSFAGFPEVKIVNGIFEDLPHFDCMVSAANSFGLMDGGVDLAIINYFGHKLESRVQQYILKEYLGEQPVGTSFIIETGHPKKRFLAHTPTMRVPIPIAHTDHVYLAMKAMVRAVWEHNKCEKIKINTIACPGLGTSTGKMPPDEAARQMALAYGYFKKPLAYINWSVATEVQQSVIYGGDLGLMLE